jgi:hypothetical protein
MDQKDEASTVGLAASLGTLHISKNSSAVAGNGCAHILQLPSELFASIVREYVEDVGIVEAWHMRTICRKSRACNR